MKLNSTSSPRTNFADDMIKSSESSFVGVVTRILADRIKHREEIPALYDEKADELAGLREIAHLFHSPKNARRLLTALPRSYR